MNIYEGCYKNFKEARQENEGFTSDIWLKAQRDTIEAILSNKWYEDYPLDYNLTAIVTMMASSLPDHRVKVLDIGGGLGATFLGLHQQMNPKICNLIYHIVENHEVVRESAEIDFQEKNLTFTEKMPVDAFDLAFYGSSIQYFENWKEIVKDVVERDVEYILFTRTPLCHSPGFVTLQNYYESKIPVNVINIDEFVQYLEDLGYTLGFRNASVSNILGELQPFPMSGIPQEQRFKYTSDVLFFKS